jgi:ATP-dependent DNA helicase RecQ
MDRLLALLQQQFGHKDFWPGQRPVIEKILAGEDTLAVMPTGSGKSLIYQLASLLGDGVTICISPLIALMKDQVDFAQSIKPDWATFLNSSLPARERRQRLRELASGRYKLLYIAPERLRSREFLSVLDRLPVSLLVIDEAHCISFWGHDFRPDYLSIKDVRRRLPRHRLLALTATATPAIQNEIVDELAMNNPARIVLGFDRPNLLLEVKATPTLARKYHTLRTLCERPSVERPLNERFTGPGIVYTGTRQEAEAISQYLAGLGVSAGFYHGGMNQEDRTRVQDSFMENRLRVLCATCAFGMGVDKPDIRFIIHWRLPANVETYYQEIGRAGRDGKPAHAVLFFSLDDQDLQARFITTDVPSLNELKTLLETIADSTPDGRLKDDLEILALQTGLDETKLRVGLSLLGRVGLLLSPSDDGKKWRILARLIRDWKRHKFENLKKIVDYGRTRTCRRRFILEYFGEHRGNPACGNCDTCLTPPGPSRQPTLEYIQTFLDLIQRRPADQKKAVQILAGSRARSLRSINPTEESAWGRFKDYNLPFLDRKFSFLIETGYVAESVTTTSPLRLTNKGDSLLAPDRSEVPGDEIEEFNRGFDRAVALQPDSEILQSLRTWRFALANKKEVPAYRIFHNSVLEAIARHLPQTLEELEHIRGVGDIKTAKYGPAILKFTRLVSVSASDTNVSDALVLDTFTARFLAAAHPTRLAGRFDAGFALDFNSQFIGGDWQRTELGQFVYDLKYRAVRDRAAILAERLAEFLHDHTELDHLDYLIPIPVSVAGRKFNPMLLVAQTLARTLTVPLGTALVKKTRETKPMKEMTNIVQKKKNINGAFSIVQPAALKGKRLLIIDDLYDTGSTIDELVKELRRAEATSVFYIALTKTIHRDE